MQSKDRLRPVSQFKVSRRNLPHFELPGSVYFLTFNTANRFILSDSAKDLVLSSFQFQDSKKYALYACVVMDDHAHCILQPMEIINNAQARRPVPLERPVPLKRTMPLEMPVTPEYYSLPQITHSIKSYSANRIQKLLNIKGSIWQDENYDRIIRDENEYLEKMKYIINNPLKPGLVGKPEDYKWLFYKGME
jgi:REP element-mobilizing transposase RayT